MTQYLLWHYLRDSTERHADRPAVAWRQHRLTYRELDEQSDRIAALLVDAGVPAGGRVALYMPKSHKSVVVMHGALKAGAVYVPIDPGAPAQRAAFIAEDCAISVLVTTGDRLERIAAVLPPSAWPALVLLADDAAPATAPADGQRVVRWSDLAAVEGGRRGHRPRIEHDPAYMLYTSGSTGTPKGVVLTHRNAMAFVDWGGDTFAVQPSDRLSNHAPLHFDLSVFDIYVALRAGAEVVMVPDQIAPFPGELAKWIDAERISVWYSVPSALVRLLHGGVERFDYRALRTVLYAGEVFPVKYLRSVMAAFRHARFYNLYGPTETNVCTFHALPPELDADATDVPIGKACANTEVFAVDERGERVGPGGTGELLVRGPTLMPGYWRRPEKTREMLVDNPLESSFPDRAYRTGDIVRMAEDGTYWFVGRRDHMVKSRGYRIELGEIEQVLHRHEQVREAVVVPIPDPEIGARLHAVVATHVAGEPTAAALQAFCATYLPRYMVPEQVTFCADLPRTSTGKADRVALTASLISDPSTPTSHVAQ